MSDEGVTVNTYQTYLEQKHLKFGVKPETLTDIVARAMSTKISYSKRIVAGEANEVYDVQTDKGNVIVRISHGEEDRFTPEKWAIDRAREVGVPAPDVLYIEETNDNDKKVQVAVETKLAGTPLSTAELSVEDKKALVIEAGTILAKIHSVVPQRFGKLHTEGIGEYESWESYMLEPLRPQHVTGLLESADKVGISREDIDRVLHILSDHTMQYQGVTPHLLHGDYGPKHILVENGHITGILDFENAKSGDQMHDFAWWSYFGKNRPPLEWLKEGYKSVAPLPDDFDLRLRLGRTRLGVNMLWYYTQEEHELGLSIVRANLFDDLRYFQKTK